MRTRRERRSSFTSKPQIPWRVPCIVRLDSALPQTSSRKSHLSLRQGQRASTTLKLQRKCSSCARAQQPKGPAHHEGLRADRAQVEGNELGPSPSGAAACGAEKAKAAAPHMTSRCRGTGEVRRSGSPLAWVAPLLVANWSRMPIDVPRRPRTRARDLEFAAGVRIRPAQDEKMSASTVGPSGQAHKGQNERRIPPLVPSIPLASFTSRPLPSASRNG